MQQPVTCRKNFLWVDDDLYHVQPYIQALEDEGHNVLTAETFSEARISIKSNDVDVVIIDVMLKLGDEPDLMRTMGGYKSGIVLARWIKQNYPEITIIGVSAIDDAQTVEWFNSHGAGYITKLWLLQLPRNDLSPFISYINGIISGRRDVKRLKIFIVHGHDEATKYELKNYIQNTLKLGEPVILHEQPSLGRTILEKFEDEASNVDVVFILLTPDDATYDSTVPNSMKRRARQNVIFELGYFLSKLERKRGRVLLLYKGELELPSDIAGLIYIDITNGIESAGERIRKELIDLLPY